MAPEHQRSKPVGSLLNPEGVKAQVYSWSTYLQLIITPGWQLTWGRKGISPIKPEEKSEPVSGDSHQ